jgi:hypothetical protein
MSKMYGGLFKETSRGLLYRNIWILDLIPDKGFYVLVQDRLWTEKSPTPEWEAEPSTMLFPTHKEAVAELTRTTTIVSNQGSNRFRTRFKEMTVNLPSACGLVANDNHTRRAMGERKKRRIHRGAGRKWVAALTDGGEWHSSRNFIRHAAYFALPSRRKNLCPWPANRPARG